MRPLRFEPTPEANSEPAGWSIITGSEDGLAHLIADPVLTAGIISTGRFVAACGRLIMPAALVAPPGHPCQLCRADSHRHPLPRE